MKSSLINLIYYSCAQFFNLLVPLLVYPYLIHKLGSENYGLLAYTSALVSYGIIVINFGFNVSAVKYVSLNKHIPRKISSIFSAVLLIKTFFLFLAIISIASATLIFSVNSELKTLLWLSLYLLAYEVFFPTWLYLGLEKIKILSFFIMLNKIIFISLIFLTVHNFKDIFFVPISGLIASIIVIVCSWIYMAKYQVVRPVKIGYKQVKLHLQISTSYFISRSAAVFTDKSVAVFIGNYIGMSSLAYYDLLLKLVEIGRAPFGILNQVFYPKIAGNKDMKLALLLIKFSAISSAFMVLAMYAYTDQIMFFLGGHEMMKYGAIFHLFSLSIITAAISYQLGNSVLVVMGREKHFNLSVIFQSCLIVCGLSVIKISDSISLYSVIFTLTIAALFELCYRSWFVRNILKSYLK